MLNGTTARLKMRSPRRIYVERAIAALTLLSLLAIPSTNARMPRASHRRLRHHHPHHHSSSYLPSNSQNEIASMRARDIKKELESQYGINTRLMLEKSELVEALEHARSTYKSRDERIAAEAKRCRSMKGSELKRELHSLGVSTRQLREKSEYVAALAEARVDASVRERLKGAGGKGATTDNVWKDFSEEEEDDIDEIARSASGPVLKEVLNFNVNADGEITPADDDAFGDPKIVAQMIVEIFVMPDNEHARQESEWQEDDPGRYISLEGMFNETSRAVQQMTATMEKNGPWDASFSDPRT